MVDVKRGRLYWYTSFQPIPYNGSRLLVRITDVGDGLSMHLGRVLLEEAYPPTWGLGVVGGVFSFSGERLELLTPQEATFYILGGDA